MATLLLDTTVIFDALNLKRGRREDLAQLLRQVHILASCPINFIEVYAEFREHEQALTDNRKHSPMPELNLHPLPQT